MRIAIFIQRYAESDFAGGWEIPSDTAITLRDVQRRIGVSRDPELTPVIPVNRGSVLTLRE